jgi:hypothetical protein
LGIGEDIKVSMEEYTQYLSRLGDHIHYSESSMKDCYGLKAVKAFLNLPYLKIKVLFSLLVISEWNFAHGICMAERYIRSTAEEGQ